MEHTVIAVLELEDVRKINIIFMGVKG